MVHNTTKKRPVDVFQEEKQHLRPVRELISVPAKDKLSYSNTDTSITRVVRKDNTILFKANRYSVPLGTYSEFGKDVQLYIQENTLRIMDIETGEVIGTHEISQQKGLLIQERAHRRDRSRGIPAYMESTADKFEDKSLALQYLAEVKERYPRYIRDQLQLLNKLWGNFPSHYINQTLPLCIKRKLYSASEFHDMVKHLMVQHPVEATKPVDKIQALHQESSYLLDMKPPTRDLSIYMDIMEGGDSS
ncbi:hypothetical protein ACE1TI_21050 [Alteribacillus sp. JSM 102045]|uniref:Mu transposase domain-containing protein n=1 Tax=Alteribacillus sp. JSM 102045 TaxID=1562101 RepID=UPI0035C0AB41